MHSCPDLLLITIDFPIDQNQLSAAVNEECASVKVDYDPNLDDDLEADLFQECSKSCTSQSKREELSIDLCLRKFIKTYFAVYY